MKPHNKLLNIPLTTALLANISLALIAVVVKVFYITLFYDVTSGLFSKNTGASLLNLFFYIILMLIILINVLSSIATIPYYKRLKKNQPVIVGYSLFFVAVMFTVEGLIGFYGHFTGIVDAKIVFSNLKLMDYITKFFPFLTDILCIICAFSFYQMAMECFREEDEPQKPITLSIFPSIWGAFTLLQVLILTTDKLFIQSQTEQALFCVLNAIFLYYTTKQFLYAKPIKRSLIVLIIQISYATISFVIVVPYLISMLLGLKDTIPCMPYFALFGISLYSVSSMFHYLFSASALQAHNKKLN